MLEISELVVARAGRRQEHDLAGPGPARGLGDRTLERGRVQEGNVRGREVLGERLGRLADQIRRDDVGRSDVLGQLAPALPLRPPAEDQVERREARGRGPTFARLREL